VYQYTANHTAVWQNLCYQCYDRQTWISSIWWRVTCLKAWHHKLLL